MSYKDILIKKIEEEKIKLKNSKNKNETENCNKNINKYRCTLVTGYYFSILMEGSCPICGIFLFIPDFCKTMECPVCKSEIDTK